MGRQSPDLEVLTVTPGAPGTTKGKWTAFLEPLKSRQQVFHLVRTEPRRVEGGKAIAEVASEVRFQMVPLPDFEFAEEPTMVSGFTDYELGDMLQAIVDEAAKIGIVASGMRDRDAEVAATKAHLNDFRRLIFKGEFEKL